MQFFFGKKTGHTDIGLINNTKLRVNGGRDKMEEWEQKIKETSIKRPPRNSAKNPPQKLGCLFRRIIWHPYEKGIPQNV